MSRRALLVGVELAVPLVVIAVIWVWSAGSLALGLLCLAWSWRRAGG